MATRRTSGNVIEGRSSDGETAPTVRAYLVEKIERLRILRAYWKMETKKLKESNQRLKAKLERRSRQYAELKRNHHYVLDSLYHLSRNCPRVEREDDSHDYSPMSPPYVPPQQMVNGGYSPMSPPYVPPQQIVNGGYSPMSPPYVPPQQIVNGGYSPMSPPYAPPNQDPIRESEESEGSINTQNSDIDE